MDALPMAPASCALDADGLRAQLSRYAATGAGAQVIERGRHRLVLRVSEQASAEMIEKLVAVETGCCPFFEVQWESGARRLTVAVSRQEHEPALAAIAHALGVNPITP